MSNNHHKSEIAVTVNRGKSDERQLIFSDSFRIGPGNFCEVQLPDDVVSAHHFEILNEGGKWWLHDLHSTNGTFLDGELIHKVQLSNPKERNFWNLVKKYKIPRENTEFLLNRVFMFCLLCFHGTS